MPYAARLKAAKFKRGNPMFYAPLTPRALRAALNAQADGAYLASLGNDNPGLACRGNVREDEKGYTFELDVPGVSRDQLSIGIEGKVVRVETLAGAPRAYKMACTLGQDVDISSSDARLENGVLTVHISKKVPTVSSIAIN